MMDRPPTQPKGVAIVREIADTYADCTLTYKLREAINLERARMQHRTYVRALQDLGLRVVTLPADLRYPDGCFVEDTVVLLGDLAMITRMGVPTRNGEQEAVGRCLARSKQLVFMTAPAQLEGGDVLKIGTHLLVGASGRTNRAGIDFLQTIACPRGYRISVLEVSGTLHLKTAVTYVGRETLIASRALAPQVRMTLPEWDLIELSDECAPAANVLNVHGTVLIPLGFPVAVREIARRGFPLKELEISEFHKGEAGLTCLSIIDEETSPANSEER